MDNIQQCIKTLTGIFEKVHFFYPADIDTLTFFKRYLEDNIDIDILITEYLKKNELNESISGIKIDKKKEKAFLYDLVKQFKFSMKYINDKILTIKKKNELKAYINIIPFKNVELGLKILFILLHVTNLYETVKLLKNAKRRIQLPKDFNALIDKDNLINIKNLKPIEKGFYDHKSFIVAYPEIDFNLLQKIIFIIQKKTKIEVKLRINKFGLKSDHTSIIPLYEERIFGIPFNTNNFSRIYNKKYGEFKYSFKDNIQMIIASLFYTPLDRLEYVIKPYDNNQVSLSLEEVIDITKNDYQNLLNKHLFHDYDRYYIKQKLLHVIFNKNDNSVSHLDLSIMIYDDDAFKIRISTHLKNKSKYVNPIIKYKIFRIDGKLDFNDFVDICILAMDANKNPEIIKFLKGE